MIILSFTFLELLYQFQTNVSDDSEVCITESENKKNEICFATKSLYKGKPLT